MGIAWSRWLDVLHGGESEGVPPAVPAMVQRAYDQYADDNGVMTSKALLKFFQEFQQDKGVLHGPMANLLLSFPSSSAKPADGIPQVNRSRSHRAQTQGHRHSRTLTRYSLTLGGSRIKAQAEPNADQFLHVLLAPLLTPALANRVSADMRLPLSHYYIYTGHNSYLKGNQLTSDSSVKPIVKALRRGVRVIELDLWPSSDKSEILVMHGGTLTRPVGFAECIRAIKEHAFAVSDYPVIITLEDHLPPPLQAIAAQAMCEVLGDMLYIPEDESPQGDFPSPYALRRRILVSTQPPKGPKELSTVVAPAPGGSFRDSAGAEACSPRCMSPRGRDAEVARVDSPADVARASSSGDVACASSSGDVTSGRVVNGVVRALPAADVACNSHGAELARGQTDWLSFRDLAEGSSSATLASGAAAADVAHPLPHSHAPASISQLSGIEEVADDPGGRGGGAGAAGEGSGAEAGAAEGGSGRARGGRESFSFPVAAEGGEDGGVDPSVALGAALSMGSRQRSSRGSPVGGSGGFSRRIRGSPSRGSASGLGWGSMGHSMGHSSGQWSGRSLQLHQVDETHLHQVEVQWTQEDAAEEAAEDALTGKVPQYRRLISIPGGKLKGGSVEEGLTAGHGEGVRRISLSETQLATAARSSPHLLLRFTQRHLLRIYPFGLRVTSSNYNPMQAWLHGAQMVAMNMQGYGRPLWLVHGFFRANGACGYVRKPACLMGAVEGQAEGQERERGGGGQESVPYNPQAVRPVELFLRVHVILGTGWYTRFSHNNFDAGGPSLLCRVAVEGAPADVGERRLDIRVGEWNPCWDDTPLLFPLTLPHLALLCFEVKVLGLSSSCYPFFDYLFEKNMYQDDFGGQVVLPVMGLKPGFRCVPLYDRKGRPMVGEQGDEAEGPRLLCQFELLKPGEEKEPQNRVPKSSTWTGGAASSKIGSIAAPLEKRAPPRGGALAVKAAAADGGAAEGAGAGAGEAAAPRVGAVLFDMDGVLCDSEDPSREAAVALFAEMGVAVTAQDFVPFMGTGEANFLGGVARVYGVEGFDTDKAKKRFFDIYIDRFARPNSGIGFPGALKLVEQCRAAGLRTAVASSADRVKVDANLAAAGIPQDRFDAIVSADKFERLKPAPDIFFAAAKELGVPTDQCVVIEDALAGVQAATAAGMRSIAVTTTLSAPSLAAGRPALIRRDIADISVADITSLRYPEDEDEDDGSSGAAATAATADAASLSAPAASGESKGLWASIDEPLPLPGGMRVTRRDAIRYSSLAMGLATTAFTLDNLKAFSYASPKALLNMLTGTAVPPANAAGPRGLVKYIQQLDRSGAADVVPDFEPRLQWLNSAPLSFDRELRGKVVLLDFWTYCCINCMHVLPDLAALEKKYEGQPVVVVGVHSAKFDNEKDLHAIRNAVLRYDVAHPVVNDGDMLMWRALGVSSWPTLALVAPTGRLIAMVPGEGNRQLFDDLIAASLEYYGAKGALSDAPIPLALERSRDQRVVASALRFPGKLASDLANGRLFISDSNNHRIVVTDLQGSFLAQIGGAGDGLVDGSFEMAQFNRPQGVAYDPSRNLLFVADTENHALRQVDLVGETVTTVAGDGRKGQDYKGGARGREQALNSPWDVELTADRAAVMVAMAGQHQIWRFDLDTGRCVVFSGSGYERNQNGRMGSDTAYAQPSGLSLAPGGREMYVADSESSALRALNLHTGGSTLIAGGDANFAENLFKFGDRDGSASRALLQHPLGTLSLDDGTVLVADSYNHKIKLVDPARGSVVTLAGTGSAGFRDGPGLQAQLSEPAGLAHGPDGTVLIADTNNSLIRCLHLPSASSPTALLSTLDLSSVPPPPAASSSTQRRRLRRRQKADEQVVEVAPVAAARGTLQLALSIPADYHFTAGATSKFSVELPEAGSAVTVTPQAGDLTLSGSLALASLDFTQGEAADSSSSSVVQVHCKVYYCQQDDLCLYKAVNFKIPFTPSAAAEARDVQLSFDITPAPAGKALLPTA
ncbi:unnamed protein product [Closterium sp. NIES-64]|nr:unnamed protein product [Closterium sp. NIES-64]